MRLSAAVLAAAAFFAAACTDVPTAPSPDAPRLPGAAFAELTCTASVARASLSCGAEAAPTGGPLHTMIVGRQNVYVTLRSTGATFNPVDSIFQAEVSVQNLMAQVFGSPDGISPTGLRVFFHAEPVALVGPGTVSVDNADGTDVFVAQPRPYFSYEGLFYTGMESAAKTWRFKVDAGVQTFTFKVLVEGRLPHEQSLLLIQPWYEEEDDYIEGLWAAPGGEVFGVGLAGALVREAGGGWVKDVSPTPQNLWDVWGSSASDVFAVGDSGAIAHWNGTAWTSMDNGLGCTCAPFYGVWGSGPGDVWAVGEGGVVLHYDGAQWALAAVLPTAWLGGVWGSGPNDVFAVGEEGAIFHYDGTDWTAMTSGLEGSGEYLNSVWGLSSTDVYAAASNGVLHYDGDSWTPVPDLPVCEHFSVWGTAADNLFVANQCGVQHWDGATWALMDPGGFEVTELWGTGPLSLLANTDQYIYRGTR